MTSATAAGTPTTYLATGVAAAFAQMKAGLIQQGSFSSFLDGFSGAHPFDTTQWKDAGGYVHLIKAPGYIMDMHFEGSSTGGGLQQFIPIRWEQSAI
jgi:hypothetical protein